ncbi:MAG TPA: hypothetical protein VF905_11755, partial [Nitrospirota bacterium]
IRSWIGSLSEIYRLRNAGLTGGTIIFKSGKLHDESDVVAFMTSFNIGIALSLLTLSTQGVYENKIRIKLVTPSTRN